MERGLAPGSEEHGQKPPPKTGRRLRSRVCVGRSRRRTLHSAQEDRMSSELDDNPSRWDEPCRQRTALAAAGGVGAALALGGLAGASRAFAGLAQNAGKVTAYFGQFGTIAEQEDSQVLLQGASGETSTRSSSRSPLRRCSSTAYERRPRPGRATSTSSSACTAPWSRSRTCLLRGINDMANQVKNLPPALVKHGKLGTKPSTTSPRRRRPTSWSPTGTCSSTCPRERT